MDSPFVLKTRQSIPLAPGLFVDIELDAAEKVAGVRVPRTALRSGNTVYVVKDNALSFREVSTLFTSADIAVLSVEDKANILPGDLVVISPVPGAYNGMQVEVKLATLDSQVDSAETAQPIEAVEQVEVNTAEEEPVTAI
ncbi:MAG: hypothetical protein HKN85_00235 [Gammaproteobacteria bacterium]|nr:hypothetical protein [Gammaproteobacteria bacterium]